MNLKEVEKHVKFDMFLTALIYIMIAVCLFLALIFTLAIPAKADSMKVYCDSGDYSSCISLTQGSSATGFNTNTITNFHTSSSYRYFSLSSMSLQQNLKYIFKIYYKPTTKSLKNVYFKEFYTDINNNSGTNEGYLNYQVDSEWGTGGYQSVATFTYQPTDTYRRNTSNYINLDFGSSGVTITGIDVTEVDSQTAQTIEELKDQQQDLLSNQCTNMLNLADYYHSENGATVQSISPNGIGIYSSNTWAWLGYQISTESGKTYYIKGNMQSSLISSTAMLFVCSDIDCNNYLYTQETNGSFSASFIPTTTTTYVRLYASKGVSPATGNYYEIMLSPENDSFCPFGTTISKLDWINSGLSALGYTQEQIKTITSQLKDIQQDEYDYLTDDSDPSIDSNGISDVMDSVEITDPLNYLLTLPISLLQKLNTVLSANSCSRVTFGSLYNTELYLPCINFEQIVGSNIWGTIDLIVGVGLLAIILKRFYDSISNVLTLGKEKEVRDKLDLPTPMQFLASILGGGRD